MSRDHSGMFESRWLNISIPATTSSVMLRGLRGCVLPCWVQGSCLGLQFTNLGMLKMIGIGGTA